MKLSQLSLADYNKLDSIPVINQDLTASGFTPVANTYYRHTGTTTDTFTQGVIYLYDTAYHKLGESGGGGGTTLNKYTWTLNLEQTVTGSDIIRLQKIIGSAKGRVMANITVGRYGYNLFSTSTPLASLSGTTVHKISNNDYNVMHIYVQPVTDSVINIGYTKFISNTNGQDVTRDNNNPSNSPFSNLSVVYYNDTEIT